LPLHALHPLERKVKTIDQKKTGYSTGSLQEEKNRQRAIAEGKGEKGVGARRQARPG